MGFAHKFVLLDSLENLGLQEKSRQIACTYSELERVVLPLLRGRVFYMADRATLDAINRSGRIATTQGKPASHSEQTENSYGSKRGWVSLFDLRDTSDNFVKEALIRYCCIRRFRKQSACAFLFIAESAWPALVSWKRASRESRGKEVFIPYIEAWYPGDVPLQLVSDTMVVEAQPDPNSFASKSLSILIEQARKRR